MVRVMGVDPGETSGWSITDDFKVVAKGQVKDWHGLDDVLFQYNPQVVVFESFNLYAGQALNQIGQTFVTVQVVGVIRYLCEMNSIPCFSQGANCKKFYSDEKLAEMGIDASGTHAQTHWVDAVRHAFYYLKFGRQKK
jgi:hypothetical protein